MLMDEPFGAIDPINRERLQNEFLRLQAEIRKTILFVTHDIDEAIKMGDRIAILQEGGQLAQYATPAELLMAPADDFVEDFVGADRALKRLALMRVRDIDLWKAPLAFVGQATAEVRAKLDGAEVPHALLVDSERQAARLALGARPRSARRVPEQPRHAARSPMLELDDVMRDALSDLLQAETQYAPVVDARRARSPACSRWRSSPTSWSPPRRRSRSTDAAERPHGLTTATARRSITPLLAQVDDPRSATGSDATCQSSRTRLLPRLGRRQLRPLHAPAPRARLPGRSIVGRARLRRSRSRWR